MSTKKEMVRQMLSIAGGDRKIAHSVINPFKINPERAVKDLRELVPPAHLKRIVLLAASEIGDDSLLRHFPEFL
jgi:hypothetical protein